MDHAGDIPIMTEPSGQQGRPAASLVTAALLLALGLGWLGGSNASRFLEFLYKPNQVPGDDISCLTHPRSSTELAEARSYLIQTASPGYTMAKQGLELAIGRSAAGPRASGISSRINLTVGARTRLRKTSRRAAYCRRGWGWVF